MKAETIEIKNNTNNTISVSVGNEEEQESRGDFHDFDYEPDDISFLKTTAQIETLTKTLQPLIDVLSRPEVAKALEALGKDKENLREEISKAFGVYVNKNDPDFSYFSCFKAGYLAGRESK